jgi:hypothetical protein
MKLLAGELSDLQAVMLQRWQDAGAVCLLGVWDPDMPSYTFYRNMKNTWALHVGKIKPRIEQYRANGSYCNKKHDQLLQILEGWYADSRAAR